MALYIIRQEHRKKSESHQDNENHWSERREHSSYWKALGKTALFGKLLYMCLICGRVSAKPGGKCNERHAEEKHQDELVDNSKKKLRGRGI